MPGIDTYTDEQAIMAHFDDEFSQPVVPGTADGAVTRFSAGELDPYLTISFGTPVSSATGRGISREETQPITSRVVVAYISDDEDFVRRMSSKGARVGTGFKPNENTTVLRLLGGGGYTLNYGATPKTIYVRETYFSWTSNQNPIYA